LLACCWISPGSN